MWIIDSLENEIRESYVHVGIDGYGRDRGYGIFLDLHSSSNLVEDNVLSTIDGGGAIWEAVRPVPDTTGNVR